MIGPEMAPQKSSFPWLNVALVACATLSLWECGRLNRSDLLVPTCGSLSAGLVPFLPPTSGKQGPSAGVKTAMAAAAIATACVAFLAALKAGSEYGPDSWVLTPVKFSTINPWRPVRWTASMTLCLAAGKRPLFDRLKTWVSADPPPYGANERPKQERSDG